ncbi:MAG: hypothetical protein ABR548_10285 [Actinomycetota bacterium]|nr:hypothetical protein [Actinomycetota bacterium]
MRGKREAVAGAIIVAAYIASAAISGHLSVLARRPLLEGSGPPPPYRWVKPPASLAATNQKPDSVKIPVKLSPPERGAGVYSTQDLQATLVVEPGSFAAPETGSLTLSVTPLDPAQFAAPAGKLTIAGNVYKIEARTAAGALVEPSKEPAHAVLVYPLTTVLATHTLLTSPDARTWTPVPGTNDSPATQQVSADVTKLGYFAVGEAKRKVTPPKKSGGVVTVIVVVVVVGGALGAVLWRRKLERRRRAARKRRGTKRR